jgi:uncharacterized membrane protein YdcZ (DUF606 family)
VRIKPYIRYVFVILFLAFVFNKNFLRPWVLESTLPQFFKIAVLSFPNFAEAVLGTIVLTMILLVLKSNFPKKTKNINANTIHWIALIIASIFVITQELKLHNLGGRNVYDPYDLIASIIGLIFTISMIKAFGLTNDLDENNPVK